MHSVVFLGLEVWRSSLTWRCKSAKAACTLILPWELRRAGIPKTWSLFPNIVCIAIRKPQQPSIGFLLSLGIDSTPEDNALATEAL